MGRRLVAFDRTLASLTVALDSIGEAGVRYPQYGTLALFPYLGDSTLFLDNDSKVFLVFSPEGRFARTMAHVKTSDLSYLNQFNSVAAGVDSRGRLIYQGGHPRPLPQPSSKAMGFPADPWTRDTLPIVRAYFETRSIDTLASIVTPAAVRPVIKIGENGRPAGSVRLNPALSAADGWAVLSDGTLAVIRAQDYHIDWVYTDGTHRSTPKMPFDWRRLTDEDKLAKIDSVKRRIDSLNASGHPYQRIFLSSVDAAGAGRSDTIIPVVSFAPLSEMADYVSPIRSGSVKPDMDGNLWILPTTSLQAKGGLLYDVINKSGEIFQRVQLPKDCDIAGFGRGGTIYLMRMIGPDSYSIERTKVTGGT